MTLFKPMTLVGLSLRNHIVMAPMTRSRVLHDSTPSELNTEYYRQRAGAGLIITEGTAPSPNGLGYPRIPGLFNNKQINGWQQGAGSIGQCDCSGLAGEQSNVTDQCLNIRLTEDTTPGRHKPPLAIKYALG